MTAPTKPRELIKRKDARARGLVTYWSGKPCPKGHVVGRYVSTGSCVECIRILDKASRSSNPEPRREATRKWREVNRQRCRDGTRDWQSRNRDKVKGYQKKLKRRLANRIRDRVRKAIDRQTNTGSGIRDLGCTVDQLMIYLEAQFAVGMSWDSWGKEWEIDHRRPLGDFDLTDRAQFLEACHFTNLQPLFIADHRAKTAAEFRTRAA